MSRQFVACKGKTACQENDSQCLSCGRDLNEVYGLRALIDNIALFAQKMEYQNSEEFFEYLTSKAQKKLAHINQQR